MSVDLVTEKIFCIILYDSLVHSVGAILYTVNQFAAGFVHCLSQNGSHSCAVY